MRRSHLLFALLLSVSPAAAQPFPAPITYSGGGGTIPSAVCGDASHALAWNGSAYTCQAITGSAAAGGSSGQVQWNNATALGGITGFTSNGTVATFANNALNISGATSGTAILNAPATGGGTFTLPVSASDTIVTANVTQTLTGKTLTTPTINGATISGTWSGNGTFTGTNAYGTPTSIVLTNATGLPLSGHTTQAADTVVMNATGGAAAPTAVAVGSCSSGTSALTYNTTTHAWGCNSVSGAVASVTSGSANITASPTTGAVVVGSTIFQNAQTGASYAIASGDSAKVVTGNNAGAQAYTIVAASTSNFTAGFGFDLASIGAGTITLTATTSVFDNGVSTLAIAKGQDAFIWSDSTNYHTAVTMPVVATSTLLGNSSGSSNYPTAQTIGSNVLTALSNALSAAGGVTTTVASGTSALGTSAIASGACASVVTTSATNTATTDAILAGFNGDPTGVTGYVPSANGMLTIISYPSANNVNFKVCNNTSASITPGAITLNWRVLR